MPPGFDRDEILKLWKEIEDLQRALGEKIPPRVVRLTHEMQRVIRQDIDRTLQDAFPGLQAVDVSEAPPPARLLCPECGAECRAVQDEGALAQAHLVNPHRPYCPACDWVGAGSGGLAGRLGARP